MTLADLKDQISNPAASAARPLEAERAQRLEALKLRVPGVLIEGDAEPSRALLEAAMAQLDEKCYIAPDKCASRLSEIAMAKPLSRVLELERQKLVLKDRQAPLDAQVNTPLLLAAAFRRRGLAFSFADVCDFIQHERYVSSLMSHLNRDPNTAFPPCQLSQVIEADRLVHVHLLEKGVRPKRQPNKTCMLDDWLHRALASYQVSFALIPRNHQVPGPNAGKNKRKRQEKKEKLKKLKEQANAEDRDAKARKGSFGTQSACKGVGAVPKAIRDKGGRATLPDGRPICFSYNLSKCENDKCQRVHVCAK